MAKKAHKTVQVPDLSARVQELEAENAKLKTALLKQSKYVKVERPSRWRPILSGLCATIAVVSFALWNVGYWTRATITDTDSFVAATAPLIRDQDIEKALQAKISQEIFSRVNLQQELTNVLPENLTFIAEPLASQVEGFATNKIGEALASEQAAQVWQQTLTVAHGKIIDYLEDPTKDSTISLSEVYAFAGSKLQDGKAGFLFGHTLPSSVGNITVANLPNVDKARQALKVLDQTVVALGATTIVMLIAAIALSTKKRNILVGMSIFTLVFMFATVAALAIGQAQIANAVAPEYSDAAKAAFSIITEQLRSQTLGVAWLVMAGLGVMLVVSEWSVMQFIRRSLRLGLDWLAGRLPAFTMPGILSWIALNRLVIAWTLVAVSFALFALRMPPTQSGVMSALVASAVVILVLESIDALQRRFGTTTSA